MLNGDRGKCMAEGRPTSTETPIYAATLFRATGPDFTIRACRDQVLERAGTPGTALVDVRSPQEYTGELIAMPAYPFLPTLDTAFQITDVDEAHVLKSFRGDSA